MNENELIQMKTKLRQHRVRNNFDRKYRLRGGIEQLERMVAHTDTLDDIGTWFGISGPRVSGILRDVLGMPYSQYLASKNIQRSGVNNGR